MRQTDLERSVFLLILAVAECMTVKSKQVYISYGLVRVISDKGHHHHNLNFVWHSDIIDFSGKLHRYPTAPHPYAIQLPTSTGFLSPSSVAAPMYCGICVGWHTYCTFHRITVSFGRGMSNEYLGTTQPNHLPQPRAF